MQVSNVDDTEHEGAPQTERESESLPEIGLRELKRLKTHRDLADAASSLVLEKGYDSVNIEDICERAHISRRTFFNYFESKDQSIFGKGIIHFGEEDEEEFLATTHQDPIMEMLTQIERKNREVLAKEMALDNTREFHRSLRDRRQEILREEPKLSSVVVAYFSRSMRRVRSAFERYFEAHPESRNFPELPTEHEVTLSMGFVRECVLYSALHLDIFDTETPLHDAAKVVTTFMRRM
nr:TetR/AcrR family transcriptional regulator [Corynebacterium lactis]